MKAIGFRAAPKEVVYSIVENNNATLGVITVGKVIIPKSLNFPEQLNFIRKTVKDIILEFSVNMAGIRVTEPTAQSLNIERISFEAILQEVICSSSIEKYLIGIISSMSSRLSIDKADFKPLIEKKSANFIDIKLDKYSDKEREAILVGFASFKS